MARFELQHAAGCRLLLARSNHFWVRHDGFRVLSGFGERDAKSDGTDRAGSLGLKVVASGAITLAEKQTRIRLFFWFCQNYDGFLTSSFQFWLASLPRRGEGDSGKEVQKITAPHARRA